jgi:hypothetical protein
MNLVKELLSLAQDLDDRSFTKEADVLDKTAQILLESSPDDSEADLLNQRIQQLSSEEGVTLEAALEKAVEELEDN